MSDARVLRLRSLASVITGPRAPIWWAMLLLIVIETTVFATLISSYLYLRLGAATWPPAGIDPPGLLLPALNTAVLFASSVAVYWGGRGIKRGDQRQLKLGLGGGVLLEIVFLSVKIYEAQGFGHGWSTHAYSSIFWSINGLHSIHVVVAILMAGAAQFLAMKDYFTGERRVGVQVVMIYWQFVAIIWVPVVIVLYLVPRWL